MTFPAQQPTKNGLASLQHISLAIEGKQILHDVSFDLQAGEILTVIGPNGAGKSTLVRIVLGLQQPDSGKVLLRPDLKIGYVPQKIHIDNLMPLTVERFIQLSGRHSIQTTLDTLAIGQLRHQPVQQLSGGEFQRVLLARALMQEPELLVLDEPAQGVDVIGQGELYDLIANLSDKQGFGVLMVSHDLHLVMQKTDHVLCLNQHICCSGEPEDVSQHPEYLKLFGTFPSHGLAVYTHHHNHNHDLHGNVIGAAPDADTKRTCQH